jgi:short-subunit dehydrogenase
LAFNTRLCNAYLGHYLGGNMKNTALITGASSGIGREFAKYHAQQGGDVIIVARRMDALKTLKGELETQYGITATVIGQDIGTPAGARALYDIVKKSGIQVDVLINNAGFGGHGNFIERNLADDLAMIDLNINSLVSLCHLIGNDMAAQGGGKILNVGSTAGMMPGPLQATYFATKAFVGSFSQAIDHELRPHGVTCTVLAPGYVETEFAKTADLGGTGLVKQRGKTAAQTAKIGYDAMMRGKLHVVNEPMLSFVTNWIIPLMPRRMALNFVSKLQAKS